MDKKLENTEKTMETNDDKDGMEQLSGICICSTKPVCSCNYEMVSNITN